MLSLVTSAFIATQTANADPRSGIRAGLCLGLDPSCIHSSLQIEAADPTMAFGLSLGSEQLGVNGRVYWAPRSRSIRPHFSFGASIDTDSLAGKQRSIDGDQSHLLWINPELIVAPGMGIDFHFGPQDSFILRPHAAVGVVGMDDNLYDYIGGSVSLLVNFGSGTVKHRRHRPRRRR